MSTCFVGIMKIIIQTTHESIVGFCMIEQAFTNSNSNGCNI